MHSPYSSSSSLASQSPISLCSSVDDEDVNARVYPDWTRYRVLLNTRGYRCDTFRDVRAFYETQRPKQSYMQPWMGYPRNGETEDDLCKDRGLPDNLFRGTRIHDGTRLIIKAVGLRSDELDVILYLSSPTLRRDPANHTIPVLDIIRVPEDDLAFIIQEEWSSSFAHASPCTLRGMLQALRQCIEGLAFMHSHHVAHLDVSLSNILTNCGGSYSYIDFELSRRFPSDSNPLVRCIRGTELPMESERGESSCPYKVDVWALGVLILRACKASGHEIPEILSLTRPMLQDKPGNRPSAKQVLKEFDRFFGIQSSRYFRRRGAPLN